MSVRSLFDCRTNGFLLQECAFVRAPRHGLTVWLPKVDGPESTRRSITFTDERLRQEWVRSAQAAYRALSGTDGEWMPCYPEARERRAVTFAAAAMRISNRERSANDDSPGEYEGVRRFLGEVVS
ncbi:hypothetical protein [Chelatococcus sp.]|uniref:hypothetical protein n=1 Tax=Chelatococcus sp. TaxID=1953771 RepID=UPI001ED1C2E4|nr:hypothetical protein [Chelatococcus sp.]MBX3545427.1 hypothetical protein [Chelatococcus sp.]CAH1650881.1 hypothetical protein CHELA41_20403 [Hyphomicrobiales bacterium]CAH1686434.1 hypothetical protein CHELA20_54523 [Hyphomicrobiales bacterium]